MDKNLYKAHPWHGVSIGADAPDVLTVYIEIVPTDTIKYEVDKKSGYLKVDRPQRFSNICPTLYGFIPQTLCDERVAELCRRRTGRTHLPGDQDPLDICVLTEKAIPHGDILLQAIPIGGFRSIDDKGADDKIIAVLKGDAIHGSLREVEECPPQIIDRLKHYFLTYKDAPDSPRHACEITHIYGREEAHDVISRSREDYRAKFGSLESALAESLRGS
jgi:inorganic pyrophosphatase